VSPEANVHGAVTVHLVDGTYELFRHFFAPGQDWTTGGVEVAATAGVVTSVLTMLEGGATHVGVATDHVIESFRNDLYPGYKSSAGVPEELLAQFGLLEDALRTLGVVVWPMVELEADDALASAAVVASDDAAVGDAGQVIICTPDKDLGQCVVDERVVQLDRRRRTIIDEKAVWAKFGVGPASIPDWLALVGDAADGFPGLPGFGAKTASAVLARWTHLEAIPDSPARWEVNVRGVNKLAAVLQQQREQADLFKDLATLRTQPPVMANVGELRWQAPAADLATMAERLGAPGLVERAERLAAARAG
jgi:5'-3' exonuclease